MPVTLCIKHPSQEVIQYIHLIPAPVDRMSVNAWLYKAKHINDPRCLRIEYTVKCYEVIHASMPRRPGGNRSCGRELCPRCPRHLVQELHVGTAVYIKVHVKTKIVTPHPK